MKVRVQYTAQLRAIVGKQEEEIELAAGATLAQLLARLAELHGPSAQPHLLNDAGHVRPSLLIVLNGSAVAASCADASALREGDLVTLLPPIAGG